MVKSAPNAGAERLDGREVALEELEEEQAGVVPEEEAPLSKSGDRRWWFCSVGLASTLCYLALASTFGVLIRCGLEDLFGSKVLGITNDDSSLFTDLPVNMVGCFFMGVLAFAWKDYFISCSEALFLSLTTGVLGCLTTYSGFNQSIATLFVAGKWASALFGLLIGVELPVVALVVGIDFGVAFSLAPSRMGKKYPRSCFGKVVNGDGEFSRCCIMKPLGARLSKIWSRIYWLLPYFVATLWFCVILPLAVIGVKFDTQSTRRREIWFGVALAPPGVWLRYLLSRYNVRPKSRVLWLPVGTFLANAIASAAMAALSTTQALVPGFGTQLWCQGVKIGVLGALSTVSTFAAEIRTLDKEKRHAWRTYAYISLSILSTQFLALLIYGVPLWIRK